MLQFEQGKQASAFAKQNTQTRLARPNGSVRNLFIRAADQPFDDDGRLLAYVAPDYSETERTIMTRRERAGAGDVQPRPARGRLGGPVCHLPVHPRRARPAIARRGRQQRPDRPKGHLGRSEDAGL